MSRNRVIGKDNKLPWHFSADLKYFKQLTTGGAVIMGRKTFQSIGKPLPNRDNFVLTGNPTAHILYSRLTDEELKKVKFLDSFEKIFQQIETPQAFIIGGGEVYRQTFGNIDGIYLTCIDADYEGDAFYPEIPAFFKEKSRTPLQDDPKIEVIFYENMNSLSLKGRGVG